MSLYVLGGKKKRKVPRLILRHPVGQKCAFIDHSVSRKHFA